MGKAGQNYKKVKKKAFLTKKDIIQLSAAVLIIAAVVTVLAIVINRDDFIRKEDGKYAIGKNWLVADFSSTSSPQYYKIGTVGDIEGYELGDSSEFSAIKYLTPTAEDANITTIYIGSVGGKYDKMAAYLVSNSKNNGDGNTTEPKDITLAGRDAQYTLYSVTADDGTVSNVATAYIYYDDTHSVYIQLNGESEITDAESALSTIASAITLEARK